MSNAIGYMPILKGRMGELRALRELGDAHHLALTPLIEVPLRSVEVDDDDVNTSGVGADIGKFLVDVDRYISRDRRIYFDSTQVPFVADNEAASVSILTGLMQKGFDAVPTVRPSDPVADLEALKSAMNLWNVDSVCLRLAGDDLDDNDAPLSEAVSEIVAQVGVKFNQVDLLIDFGPLSDEQAVTFAARVGRLILGEVLPVGPWNTITVASGGFPADLNNVPPEVMTRIPRYDALLWNLIVRRFPDTAINFSDYGVAYAVQGVGAPFAPAPQLRFTSDESWLIYKGRKRDPKGSNQFYDICRRMVAEGVVDAQLSWGDNYVEAASKVFDFGTPGPGNAAIWRAIGTSHHLNYVVNRLASLRVP